MPQSDDVRSAFQDADRFFPTGIQKFQFFDKYSRYSYKVGRRETWIETVDRTVDYLRELSRNQLPDQDYTDIRQAILNMEVMPSMRSLAMAGDAARRSNIAIYNCSAMPVIDFDVFVEALIISMNGCGVGFSVERQFVDQLPVIWQRQGGHADLWVVEDTTEGWADALRYGLGQWAQGIDVVFDYKLVRPAGAVLRVKGGSASGPEPLKTLLDFARSLIFGGAGRKLTPLECHDLMCMVGSAAVSGGVRRTAMISLFDMHDEAMLHCKDGEFPSYRWNANNSAVWNSRLTEDQVDAQLQAMADSGGGEPGIFSRWAAANTSPCDREQTTWLTNPCAEIVLRSFQFCNLTSIVARPDDTIVTLVRKAKLATIIGTIQSLATHFPGLRPEWKANAEAERLLGVSLDGQMDSEMAQDPDYQSYMREICRRTNVQYAKLLGINKSAAITCVKPSGNSSQLLNCSSGIHARWSPYYIRNIRVGAHNPLYKVLRDAGVPMDPENGQSAEDAITWVIHFPVAAPIGSRTRNDRSAIEQCEYWLQVKNNWTDHNPSITVTYKPEELPAIKAWVYKHQAVIGGMAFLPSFDATYDQLPYQECTKAEYETAQAAFPLSIDFGRLVEYESRDNTSAAQEVACMSGLCEI